MRLWTYTNDCNFFDMVLQTLRLLAGILLGHDKDEVSDAEIGEVDQRGRRLV